MSLLRLSIAIKTCFFALALLLAQPAMTATDATQPPGMEVGFGYLGQNGVIYRIMYYQNGEWQKPLSAYITPAGRFSGIEPHDTIVNAWLNAKTSPTGDEVDCKKADTTKYEQAHCAYTQKLDQPLKNLPPEALASFLKTLRPTVRDASTQENIALFTPPFLTRLLAWKTLRADKFDVETYATVFWDAKPSGFAYWFDMRSDNPDPFRSVRGVFHDPSAGDCSADAPGVKIKVGTFQNITPGWVSTQKWGYRWNAFEKLAELNFHPQSGAAHPANTEVPLPYAALLAQAKKQWESVETRTIPYKLKLPPNGRYAAKKRLEATPFRKLSVERAISYQNRSAIVLFYGEKSLRVPGKSPDDDAGTLDIYYRAWIVRQPDGQVEWISSRFDMDPAAARLAQVDDAIAYIAPHALLEIDGKQFIVTASNLRTARSTTMRSEIFELINNQFKSRGIYGGACGNGVMK